MTKTSIILLLGLVAVSLVAGFLLGRSKIQTAYYPQPYPVTVEKPVPVHDTVYATRTVYLPKVTTVHDTVNHTVATTVHHTDTVQVEIPITTKDYEEQINDAIVKATVSGYEPVLEQITVENLRICPPTSSTRRFSIGVGVGYGIGLQDASHGVFSGQPFVGVSLNYNFLTF